MIVTTILKPVLLFLRYPRFHGSTCGPHNDIGAHIVRVPDSTACQVFYPADTSSLPTRRFGLWRSSRKDRYFRKEAVEGLADFCDMNSAPLRFLHERRHPCAVGARPKMTTTAGVGAAEAEKSSFPVVIFSHGLGGSYEMYTNLCRNIASYGFVVIAMEHEDGSASFAQRVDGERISYKKPDDTPYSREKVLGFRGEMYEDRMREVGKLLEYLVAVRSRKARDGGGGSGDDGVITTMTEDPIFDDVMAIADLSNGVSLLGHSFGGTTVVLAQQRLQSTIDITTTFNATSSSSSSSSSSTSSKPLIRSVAVLDPWCFSLPDETLNTGVKTTRLLSVLSSRWGSNPESAQVHQLLRNSDIIPENSWIAPQSVHQSFSDTYGWMPGFVTKKLGMRARGEGMHEVVWEVAEVCARFFRRELGEDEEGVEEEGEMSANSRKVLLPFSTSFEKKESII